MTLRAIMASPCLPQILALLQSHRDFHRDLGTHGLGAMSGRAVGDSQRVAHVEMERALDRLIAVLSHKPEPDRSDMTPERVQALLEVDDGHVGSHQASERDMVWIDAFPDLARAYIAACEERDRALVTHAEWVSGAAAKLAAVARERDLAERCEPGLCAPCDHKRARESLAGSRER